MTDGKVRDIFLVAFFGMAGIAVLILAWIQPMSVPDRILTTFAGSAGLLLALTRTIMLRLVRAGVDAAPVPVEPPVGDIRSGVYTKSL